VAIVRIAVHWEHETDLWQGVHVDGGERLSPPGQCIDGESPPWGRGWRGGGRRRRFPPPLSRRVTENLSRGITPASRPLRGLLPPPQGGGQCVAIVRIAVHWEHETDLWQGVHVDGGERLSPPGQCIDGESPPWGRGWRGGGRRRRFPPPLSRRVTENLSRGITPASRPLRGLLPPPQGGGQCVAIVPDTVHRGA